MKRTLLFLSTLCLLLQLAGCGGGGGGTPASPAPAAIAVTLSTTGTLPSGKLIGDIEITLNLPAGVTAKASPSLINASILVPNDGVIVLQGAAATAPTQILTAAYVQGTTNKVVIKLENPNGLGIGAFAKINCDVVSGSTPSITDFSITSNVAATTGVFDLDTAALSGVQVTSSAVMQ
jgi:hypothetical protein